MVRIFLIAGEPSGDVIGGKLMRALKTRFQDKGEIEWHGIGGQNMESEGLKSQFPMTELSLMGYAEIIPHIPKLLKRITETAESVASLKPDIFITIDAPEFSFRVARKIQAVRQDTKMLAVHYVAPSVWAYRPKRAEKVAGLYDLLLHILPFEASYFEPHGLECSYVGHPIMEGYVRGNPEAFFEKHAVEKDSTVICVTPGSRSGEIARLWPVYQETLTLLVPSLTKPVIVIPTLPHLEGKVKAHASTLPCRTLVISDAAAKRDAMAAAKIAIAKSGTNTLELAMAGAPMVVSYKVNWLTAFCAKRMLNIPYVSLINLIANKAIIPELLQEQCTPQYLASTVLDILQHEEKRQSQIASCEEALKSLGFGSPVPPSEKGADAIRQALEKRA